MSKAQSKNRNSSEMISESSTDNNKVTDSEPAGLLGKARKYRTEIVIAVSTTCIMGGIVAQHEMGRLIMHNTELMKNPKMYQFWANALYVPIPQLLIFFLIPVLTLLFLREPLYKYGFRIGDWKKGLLYTFLCIAALTPLLYWSSTMPSFQQYYQRSLQIGYWWVVLQWGLYMFSWEFLLRGFIYFSLEERVGTLAIWLQSVPFAVAHLGKPAPEALTCFFGGLVLGWIAMKTRSFLYPFLIHWGIYVTLVTFIFVKMH